MATTDESPLPIGVVGSISFRRRDGPRIRCRPPDETAASIAPNENVRSRPVAGREEMSDKAADRCPLRSPRPSSCSESQDFCSIGKTIPNAMAAIAMNWGRVSNSSRTTMPITAVVTGMHGMNSEACRGPS